jgi:hypothetical protein
MMICKKCSHKEIVGAMFCSNCGARLVDLEGISTDNIVKKQENLMPTQQLEAEPAARRPEAGQPGLSVHVLKTGQHLALFGQEEYTLGRVSDGQSVVPDVDLSPFDGYHEGVSRIHASLKVEVDKVSLIDLNSVNGTAINDEQIPSNEYHELHHGDIITLGKLKLQILLRKPA